MRTGTDTGTGTEGLVDEDDFAGLFFGHAARLVRLAALLGDDDPEDVVQESYCKLYAARTRLLPGRGGATPDGLAPYLNRIVVNEVRDRHRRRSLARRDAHLVSARDVAPPTSDPGDRSDVVAVLAALPQRQREALVLRFWLDLPLAEIAHVMGVRTGTVKSQISGGLATMQVGLVGHDLSTEVE